MSARTMHSLTRHLNQIIVVVNEPDARMSTYVTQTKFAEYVMFACA